MANYPINPFGEGGQGASSGIDKEYVDNLFEQVSNVLNTITQDGATAGVIDTFNEVKAFLAGISNSDTLVAKLTTLVPQTRTINGKPLSSNVTIGMSDIQGLVDAINNAGSGAVSVSVPNPSDGTFTIHVGSTDYTINLNHTHEGMAKLVVDTAANLPDIEEMDEDTIYGEEDNGEISVLYVGGIPFYGGSGGSTPTPILRRPENGTTIDLGTIENGTLTETVNVKGRNLTQPLTVELDGTGYTFAQTQPSGVTIVSTTEITITAAAANSTNGVDVSIVYTGNAIEPTAELSISSTTDNINVTATLVATADIFDGVIITANKALVAASGTSSYNMVDAPGFCVLKFNPVNKYVNHKIHYGFNPVAVYNDTGNRMVMCAFNANDTLVNNGRYELDKGTPSTVGTNTAHWRTFTSDGDYMLATMSMENIRDCYVYDSSAQQYLWNPFNNDQSLDT